MKKFNTGVARIKNSEGKYEMLPALRGATSYEVAVRNGFEGTEDDWLSMMIDDGWVAKCQELDENKADKDSVYTKDEIMSINSSMVCIPSYLTFVGNINANMVTAAFGKGNEDVNLGVGKALAMYGWFKGEDKLVHPYANTQIIETVNGINRDACVEIINSDYVSSLVMSNAYARDKFFEQFSANASMDNYGAGASYEGYSKTDVVEFVVNDEDISQPFRLSYTIGVEKYGSKGVGGAVYINNVLVDSYYASVVVASGDKKTMTTILKSWSDYGIVTPGTYTIKAVSTDVQSGVYANGQPLAEITLCKLKQSYGI